MKKFVLTEEDRNRIRVLYNLQEQSTILANVSGNYNASNCDELHAFQGTGGKVIGNMNVMVRDKINELINQGHKVKVTNVRVNVKGMNVNWVVTISESDDNKNWVGFTSRGAGCNGAIDERWNSENVGNGPNSIIKKIQESKIGIVDKIELVNKFEHRSGNNSFIQGFYRYCLQENSQQTNGQNINQTNNVNEFEIFADNPQRFLFDVKTKSQNQSIDTNSVNLIFDTSRDSYKLKFKKGNTSVKYLTIALNMVDDEKNKSFPSKDTILSKNPGSFVVKENVFNDANGQRRWAVIAIV